MRDGVEIAVTINLPADLKPGQRVPVLMRTTRYWRSKEPRRSAALFALTYPSSDRHSSCLGHGFAKIAPCMQDLPIDGDTNLFPKDRFLADWTDPQIAT